MLIMKRSTNNFPPLTPAWMDRWPMNLSVDGDGTSTTTGEGGEEPTTNEEGGEGPPRPDEGEENGGRPVED